MYIYVYQTAAFKKYTPILSYKDYIVLPVELSDEVLLLLEDLSLRKKICHQISDSIQSISNK